MARFSRLEVLNTIVETGLIPLFYHSDVAVAKKITAGGAAPSSSRTAVTLRHLFSSDCRNISLKQTQHYYWRWPGHGCPDRGVVHLVATGNYAAITAKTAEFLLWIREVRSEIKE